MIVELLLVLGGLALLVLGGDLLVKGAVGLSLKLGMTPLVVGLTVVAFGTSAPELLVSLSAALTVILASWLGLPVSSTHIAIGGIFGVGFFREWYHERIMGEIRVDTESTPEQRRRKKVVRRSHFTTILAAWLITVPAAAVLSAVLTGVSFLLPADAPATASEP